VSGEDRFDPENLPDRNIVVEEPFSERIICEAIRKWLRSRGYQFQVKMVPINQAKGSGLLKELGQGKKSEEDS